jgi:hypothetical protein
MFSEPAKEYNLEDPETDVHYTQQHRGRLPLSRIRRVY